MFLRAKKRIKDGKEHRYWSIVEIHRVAGDRIVQRQVLYLGEINDSQKAAWCRSIAVLRDDAQQTRWRAFPKIVRPRCWIVVQVKFSGLQLNHPRQWGDCGLSLELWDQLQLDAFLSHENGGISLYTIGSVLFGRKLTTKLSPNKVRKIIDTTDSKTFHVLRNVSSCAEQPPSGDPIRYSPLSFRIIHNAATSGNT